MIDPEKIKKIAKITSAKNMALECKINGEPIPESVQEILDEDQEDDK